MADSVTGSSSVAIQSSYEKYKSYFSTKDPSDMDQSDFLKLMTEQLKSQDFNNPTDNTQFIAQMAQFTALSSQQQATYYAQASYAANLVGKTVVVGYLNNSGNYVTDEGTVSAMQFSGNDFKYVVNGTSYESSNIMEVKASDVNDMSVLLTKTVDTSLIKTIPSLTSKPSIIVGFTGKQSVPLTVKLVNGDEDAVTAYTSDDKSATLTIALKELDTIESPAQLVTRTNAAITAALDVAADKNPILTDENYTAGKLSLNISTSGCLRTDGTNLTQANISDINKAAVKTLINLGSFTLK